MMQLQKIIEAIEAFAPPALQESYDNSGLIVGSPNQDISKALLCLDSTEAVIDEAISIGANLVIAHHPIIFGGLKKLNGKNYVERVVMKAIKNDIAIYAAHTNLDNVQQGVNAEMAKQLGLQNTKILSVKKETLRKIFTFCPVESTEKVRLAMFEAGGGTIGNYDECSFNVDGLGTFIGNENANPVVGERGKRNIEPETKIEMIFPFYLENKIVAALKKNHPYEEIPFDIISLENNLNSIGSGMIGELPTPMDERDFLEKIKTTFNCGSIRHTNLKNKMVKKVALCGGSGSFLLSAAKRADADFFITADFKYHEFFDAENQLVIADIGHYESEQFTINIFYRLLTENFPTFALQKTKINTNPINYF